MKVLYATSVIYPSPYANRKQIKDMSRALSLLLPNQFTLGVRSLSEDLPGIAVCSFPGTRRSFILAWKYVRYISRQNITHVYCREEKLLYFLMLYSRLMRRRKDVTFLYEAHWIFDRTSWWYRSMVQHVDVIVCITECLAQALEVITGRTDIHIAPDGVDVEAYSQVYTKEEICREFSLPYDKHIVMYTGSVFKHAWKGVDVLLSAVRYMPKDVHVVIVGCRGDEEERIQSGYGSDRITTISYMPERDIQRIIYAADIAVVPNKTGSTISECYTSPLKLFEYLAAGRVIVVADLPSMREVVDEKSVYFFEPNNARNLASVIQDICEDQHEARLRAEYAQKIVSKYDWKTRAKSIIRLMKGA